MQFLKEGFFFVRFIKKKAPFHTFLKKKWSHSCVHSCQDVLPCAQNICDDHIELVFTMNANCGQLCENAAASHKTFLHCKDESHENHFSTQSPSCNVGELFNLPDTKDVSGLDWAHKHKLFEFWRQISTIACYLFWLVSKKS